MIVLWEPAGYGPADCRTDRIEPAHVPHGMQDGREEEQPDEDHEVGQNRF
jgi:hypothetical protein